MGISDLFSRVMSTFRNTSDSTKAYNELNEGKKITYSPKSDRYTFGNQQDTDYNKNWKPETPEEKATLSPQGYFRVGERKEARETLKKDIFQSALDRIRNENKHASDESQVIANPKKEAEKEAEAIMNDEYNEKQVSVDSTAIADFDYDPKTENLEVRFQGNPKSYYYPHVPLELIQAWLKAPSKGEFFSRNIHDQYTLNPGHRSSNNKQIAMYNRTKKQNAKANWLTRQKNLFTLRNTGKK